MSAVINLPYKLNRLGKDMLKFLRQAAELAAAKQARIYLVGGIVRDLLLDSESPDNDIDIAIDGDAVQLALRLAEIYDNKYTIHRRFNTATLICKNNRRIDFASTRKESYARPGALPKVSPATIAEDLIRRDFSINAMALSLQPNDFGELTDRYGGASDVANGLIRILHGKSFIDDATRIWRAIRYEQRLNFTIEEKTLKLLKDAIPYLDTVSGDRIRYELECVFQETSPEKILLRADRLGVLERIHPSLKATEKLRKKFNLARKLSSPETPTVALYFTLFTSGLTECELEKIIAYLHLTKKITQTLRERYLLAKKLPELTDPVISHKNLYRLLTGYSETAIMATAITSASPVAIYNISHFLNTLRYVKTTLKGKDLLKLGVPAGPSVSELLQALLDARLEGKVSSRQDEERLVRKCHSAGLINFFELL